MTVKDCKISQNVDIDQTSIDTLFAGGDLDIGIVFLKEFFEKANFGKISRRQRSMKNYPEGKELIHNYRPRF